MPLCGLCSTIDFFHLPALPSNYEGYTKPWIGDGSDPLVTFLDMQEYRARKAGRNVDAGEFSQPLGVPHHQSIQELRSAAERCSICSLIDRAVVQVLAALADAENDEQYTLNWADSGGPPKPDFRLFVCKRRDSCDGFMVVSQNDKGRNDVWLLTVVGFCVADDDPLRSQVIGRPIEAEAASETTILRALNWVQECKTSHAGRCASHDVVLPLRVLDIGDDSTPATIKLVEMDGAHGKYTALSHCWGTRSHFTTTSQNYAIHQAGIDVDHLPQTFQDAIIVTRRLGIRYLWIDSLCIRQDDGPEWERQSARMASIYANAFVTIAATGSSDDSDGFLTSRTTPRYSPFGYTKDGVTGDIQAFLLKREEGAHTKTLSALGNEPLSSRGWALQERYLATRTLHFASRQMFFECYTHFVSEDGFRVEGRYHTVFDDAMPKDESEDSSPRRYRGPELWYELLHAYYSRHLTKSSDKLPALSGLARTFQKLTGDQYVAGLWRSQLIEGLVWQAMGTKMGKTKAPPVYRAPSWSWASMDGPFGNTGLGSNSLDPKATWVDVASVVECHLDLKGQNPFGEVLSGKIILRAPVEPLSRSDTTAPDPWLQIAPHRVFLQLKTAHGNPEGSYAMFDTLDDEEALKLPLFALVLAKQMREGEKPKDRSYQALVITPIETEKNVYRRVGKLPLGEEALGKCDWMDDPTHMQTITLV